MIFYYLQSKTFDWRSFLLGSENWDFLPETAFRTAIMFLVILTALRILGKRGVKQLSVFELVVIIGLGSAAGDPMFYKDVGLLPAFVVFGCVIILYSAVTYMIGKNKSFEHLIEGKPVCLVKEGAFTIKNFKKEALGQDEFFAELRLKGVSHLGQVEMAIIETVGEISIYFYGDDDVKWGLPIMPDTLKSQVRNILSPGIYACTFCGVTQHLSPAEKHLCPNCTKDLWVEAANNRRIT